MRKITEQANFAWYARRNFNKSNTEIIVENGCRKLYLFGNLIACDEVNGNGKPTGNVVFGMCGYNTVTTRERISGILGIKLKTRQETPYVYIQDDGWHPINESRCYIVDKNGKVHTGE